MCGDIKSDIEGNHTTFFFLSDRFAFLHGMNHGRKSVDPNENGRVADLSHKRLGQSARVPLAVKNRLKRASPFMNKTTDCFSIKRKKSKKLGSSRIVIKIV